MECTSCKHAIPTDAVFCPYCSAPVEGTHECCDYTYEAFISYRHLPLDKDVAKRLQRRIEGFRIPRALRTPGGPKRLGKLFRDEDELPTSSSLPDQISDALRHARFLFVICSRDTPRSTWVQQEVLTFASYHGRDRIRLVLVEGEPEESFPPLLLQRWHVEGDTVVAVPTEPLAANLQGANRRQFNIECLRLVAPLIGCGFDDLRNRQRQRMLRLAASAAALVTTVSTAFGAFSYYQQQQIEHNYHATQIRESELLAEQAEELALSGDRFQAINVALAALPTSPASSDRPLVPAAQLALEEALEVYPGEKYWFASFSTHNLAPDTEARAESNTGLLAYASIEGTVRVIEAESGTELLCINLARDFNATTSSLQSMAFAGDFLVCLTDNAARCYNVRTGALVWSLDAQDGQTYYLATSTPNGSAVAVISESLESYLQSTVTLLNARDGSVLQTYEIPQTIVSEQSIKAAFNKRGTLLAVGEGKWCVLLNIKDGSVTQATLPTEVPADMGTPYHVDRLSWVGGKLMVGMESWRSTSQCERIVALDRSLNVLWQADGQSAIWINDEGIDLGGKVGVWGTTTLQETGETRLVALLGNKLVLLNEQTGEQTATLAQGDSPFLACYVSPKGGIAAYRADGLVGLYSPDRPDYPAFFSHNVGDYVAADFAPGSSGPYLVGFAGYGSVLRVFSFDGERSAGIGTPIEVPSNSTCLACNRGTKTYLMATTDEGIFFADARNPTDCLTASYQHMKKLKTSSASIMPSNTDDVLLVYGRHEEEYDKSVIYEISATTGDVLGATEIADADLWTLGTARTHPLQEVERAEGSSAYFIAQGKPRLVEKHTGTVLATYEHSAQVADPSVQAEAFLAPDHVVVLAEGTIEVFNAADGQPTTNVLSSYRPYGGKSKFLAFSEDGTRMAMLCDDGAVRLFDLAADTLLWETEPQYGPTTRHLALASASSNVLLQSRAGTLTLLAGSDGAATTAYGTLPSIDDSWDLDDPNLLAVRCDASKGSFVNGRAVAIVSLDPEALGPISYINNAWWLSNDGELALVRIGKVHRAVHRATLDELMAMAAETVEGHELTNEERIAYHVGS